MRFYQEMIEIRDRLVALGLEVELPEAEEKKVDYLGLPDNELATAKRYYIDAHLTKIKNSDCVLLVNPEKDGIQGYVGANTLMEAAFAFALDKPIYVLYAPGEQPCRAEMLGMQPTVLFGNISSLR